MERTGIAPVTSGLQTRPIARPRLTPSDRMGMTEPKRASTSDVARHRSTVVRTALAPLLPREATKRQPQAVESEPSLPEQLRP